MNERMYSLPPRESIFPQEVSFRSESHIRAPDMAEEEAENPESMHDVIKQLKGDVKRLEGDINAIKSALCRQGISID